MVNGKHYLQSHRYRRPLRSNFSAVPSNLPSCSSCTEALTFLNFVFITGQCVKKKNFILSCARCFPNGDHLRNDEARLFDSEGRTVKPLVDYRLSCFITFTVRMFLSIDSDCDKINLYYCCNRWTENRLLLCYEGRLKSFPNDNEYNRVKSGECDYCVSYRTLVLLITVE